MQNMKIMVDTNIFLDVLLDRMPLSDSSSELLSLCENHKLDGFVSASCITDIFYIVRKSMHSTEMAYQAIGKIFQIVKICSVTNHDIFNAYLIHAKDFEDCLLAVCAKSNACECIITRNKKDFSEFGIPLFTPEEILSTIK